MLSDELETLAAHVIDVLGVNTIAAQSIVRSIKACATDARLLEQRLAAPADTIIADNVTNLEHARRQKRLSSLAHPINEGPTGGNRDRDN